jgi:actin-related protein 8
VIHPGSKYLRIGRASEAFPSVVPHVIARRVRNKKENETQQVGEKKVIKVEDETIDINPVNGEIKKEDENEEIKETKLDEEDIKESETCSDSASSSVATEEEDDDEVRIFYSYFICVIVRKY